MTSVRVSLQWQFGPNDGGFVADPLLALLEAVQDGGGIAQAARALGWSYRHAWGLLRQGEALLGQPLLQRGRGRGSRLTDMARRLIWAQARSNARLQPLLESLASEIEADLGRNGHRAPSMPRLQASHGFAVAALRELLLARRIELQWRYRSSLEAVAALAQGDCDLAGFHVPMGEFQAAAVQRYRPWLQPQRHRLVQLAVRTQGLFVARGNPHRIGSLADVARRGLRFVNRPEGSGTRVLIDLLLQREGIAPAQLSGHGDAELTHAAVAAYVASGMADVGLGVETAARRFGLDFIALLKERYFFAIPVQALEDARLRPVLEVLGSAGYRRRVAALPGYDAAETGRVLTVEEAFG
ncbi:MULTISPECIES: substrate-binding domain-containing protein [Caldimonas]|uniref:helix-turn-helix transcriptional regulator n=1 Tax=Caldimonas TaxID=196013 RepID=UPI00035D2209|nr:substrate-binding domain-containing protein [Caldimonas manganoxidans]GIX23978.1 MAG: LysR family transcriptional regulator [Caldimonas sp.]